MPSLSLVSLQFTFLQVFLISICPAQHPRAACRCPLPVFHILEWNQFLPRTLPLSQHRGSEMHIVFVLKAIQQTPADVHLLSVCELLPPSCTIGTLELLLTCRRIVLAKGWAVTRAKTVLGNKEMEAQSSSCTKDSLNIFTYIKVLSIF